MDGAPDTLMDGGVDPPPDELNDVPAEHPAMTTREGIETSARKNAGRREEVEPATGETSEVDSRVGRIWPTVRNPPSVQYATRLVEPVPVE